MFVDAINQYIYFHDYPSKILSNFLATKLWNVALIPKFVSSCSEFILKDFLCRLLVCPSEIIKHKYYMILLGLLLSLTRISNLKTKDYLFKDYITRARLHLYLLD